MNRIASIVALGCALCAPLLSFAQTSYPFIFSMDPTGFQRGSTVTPTLLGLHNFHGAYKVMVSGKGVRGEVIVPDKGWPPADPKTNKLPDLNSLGVKFVIAPDAPLGVREVRVATPRGVSSVGMLVVGDEPEVMEKEPNNELSQAQEVPVPITINGKIQQGEDVDSYKFKAKAGEQLTFSVLCMRLQDKIHDLQQHADPLLSLRDASGRELAANDDYYRGDPMLSHRFEKEGEYSIQIRDVNFAGNPYWVYRLNITRRPFVTAFLPMGGKPGQSGEVKPVGFNLPAGSTARIDIPADGPMGSIQQVTLKTPMGESNPVPAYVSEMPVQTYSAPAGQLMQATFPAAISGRLGADREVHKIKFKATKGQMFVFEALARRFDSRIDSVLTLMNDKEQEITNNDDSTGPDSRIEWQAPADGEYILKVEDLHLKGGDNYVYLLTAKLSMPHFTLKCDDDKMKIAPGGFGAWYVHVDRKFGFAAPINVEVRGLPAGVTAAPLVIPPNMSQGCLILSCAPGAKMDVTMAEVIGTAVTTGSDGKPMNLSVIAAPQSEIYLPGGGRGLLSMDTQPVAVVPVSDITIALSTTNVTLAPGGTAKIDVTITRAPGFTKAVTLDVFLRHLGQVYGNPLPPGVTLDEGASKVLLSDTETKGHIVLKAEATAVPATNVPIAILGGVSINFVVKVSYSGPPLLLTVMAKK